MKNLIPVLSFDPRILAGQISDSSMDTYKRQFEGYLQFATSPELALQPETLARWAAYLSSPESTLSPNTINNKLAAVRSVMMEAANQGFITYDLADRFKRVNGVKVQALKEKLRKTTRTIITDLDMAALVRSPGRKDLIDLRDTAILHTAASSGLRAQELATLELWQIRKEGNGYLLSVRGKNEVEYSDAALSSVAYEAIQEWIKARFNYVNSSFVFTAFDGPGKPTNRHISPAGLWKLVKKYSRIAGLEGISTHSIRRFVGTRVAKQKGLEVAQKILRHKNIKTTADHYVLGDLEPGLTDGLYN